MAEEHDGKVVFDLDVDDSQIKQRISKALSDAERALKNGKPVKVAVDADTSGATTNLHKVKAAADALESSDPTVTVDADTAGATTNLNKAKAAAEAVEGTDPTVTVDADTSGAEQALDDLSDSIDEVEKKASALKVGVAQGVGQSIGNAGMSLASGAVKSAIGFAGDVFSGGMTYETALAKASTLMPETADLDRFSDGLLALANDTGEDINVLAEAAYNMLSASVGYGDAGGDQLLAFLRGSAQLGVGGFSDTNSAGLAVKKTLNAYGLTDADQQRVANMMIKTQNKGITDVDKLSASMSNITSTAAAAGVSIEEVGAMLATITAQGTETAEATTQARSLLSELMAPDTDAYKSMQKALQGTKYKGMGINEIMAAGGNMVEILSAMQSYGNRNGIQFIEMFGSIEAYNAALKLVNENGAMYLSNLEYMLDDTDVVRDAYETMADTNAMTLKKISAQLMAVKMQLYMALAPAIEKLLGVIDSEKFRGVVSNLTDKIVEFLSGDGLYKIIDGLVAAAEWLLAVLSGDISLRDELDKWVHKIGDWLIAKLLGAAEWVVNGLIDVVNGFIDGLNMFLGFFGGHIDRLEKVDWTPDPAPRGGGGGGTDGNGASRGGYTNGNGVGRGDIDAGKRVEGVAAAIETAGEAVGASFEAASRWTRASVSSVRSLNTALSNLVGKINGYKIPTASGNTSTAQKFAVGLDVVPYDNYPALLHRGEMVLNAAEASAYRSGSAHPNGVDFDYVQMAAAMKGMTVEMDGKTVGRLVERSVSAAQSDRLHRYSGRK